MDIVELVNYFADLADTSISSITEVSITALFDMEAMEQIRMIWNGTDYTSPRADYSSNLNNITLEPQRIRAFVATFENTQHVNEIVFSF